MAVENAEVSGEVTTQAGEEVQSSAAAEQSGRSALEARVAESLKALNDDAPANDDTTVEKTVQSGEEVATKQPDGEAADDVVEGEATDEGKEGEQTTPEKPAAATPAAKPSTLPAAYIRSLKAMEWTDAEIAEAEKNPQFLTTAAKLHQTRNQEISQWAALGRAKQQEAVAHQQANPQQYQGLQTLQPTDAAALKQKYGNDELIDSIVGPINATVAQINAILPIIQQTQQNSVQSHLDTLGRQVEAFFGGDELKAYGELYGSAAGGKTLTPENTTARNNVLQTADALIVGARLQGRSLTLNEALALAHDSTSGGFKAKAARAELKGALQKRGQSITLKPTGKKGAGPAVKAGDRSSLEAATKARLAAAFA